MKILLLTFYYPPDLSAGSFRAHALIEALDELLPAGARLDVLTTQPNRYATLEASAAQQEHAGRVSIERIALPQHRSGMLDQARAFMRFAWCARARVKGRQYDLVVATSSRLMTAVLGAYLSRRCGAALYLDIRDIFVDTLKDVMPGTLGRLMLPVFGALERYAVRAARGVNLVSAGFTPYFRKRYPGRVFDEFTNGIDEAFLAQGWEVPTASAAGPVKVLYAGNIGEGQGLHRILPALARAAGDAYVFQVIGDGGRRPELERELVRLGVRNVSLHDPVPRAALIEWYRQADVLFLHLNDYDAFAKVLPSKLFEYAATGKPILAGIGGFSAAFAGGKITNATVFPPCDAEAGLAALKALELGWTARADFVAEFERKGIMRRMARRMLEGGLLDE